MERRQKKRPRAGRVPSGRRRRAPGEALRELELQALGLLYWNAMEVGVDPSDLVILIADADHPASHPMAVYIKQVAGRTERNARRELMQQMTEAAACGQPTIVGGHARLSVMRKKHASQLEPSVRRFLQSELPPGHFRVICWSGSPVRFLSLARTEDLPSSS